MWVDRSQRPRNTFYNATVQPITVTSEYAEIIYFLRNGNLYRRVLLVAPELQSAIVPSVNNLALSSVATAVRLLPDARSIGRNSAGIDSARELAGRQ